MNFNPKETPQSIYPKSWSLADLMWLNERKEVSLEEGFSQYDLLIRCAKETIKAWNGRKFEQFDALVGENACQIRAIFIAVMAKQGLKGLESLKEALNLTEKNILRLRSPHEWKKLVSSHQHFEEVYKNESLRIPLSKRDYFLILCYILTIAKKVFPQDATHQITRNEKAAPENLKSLGNITISFANKLHKLARKDLAVLSIAFMKEWVGFATVEEEIESLISDPFIQNYHGTPVIPCFASFQIAKNIQFKFRIPFILSVQQHIKNTVSFGETLTFLLNYDEKKRDYYERDIIREPLSLEDVKEVTIVVEGFSSRDKNEFKSFLEWKRSLLEIPLQKSILAYSAAHRQYPDDTLDKIISLKKHPTLYQFKLEADEWGCSRDNPSRLFVNHIFASSIAPYQDMLLKTSKLELPPVDRNKAILFGKKKGTHQVDLAAIRAKNGNINEIRMLLKGDVQTLYSLFREAVEEGDAITEIVLSYALFGIKWGKDRLRDFRATRLSDLEEFEFYPRNFALLNIAYDAAFESFSTPLEQTIRGVETFVKAIDLNFLPAILEFHHAFWYDKFASFGFATSLRPFVGKGDKQLDYFFGLALKDGSLIGSPMYYEGLYWIEKSKGLTVKYPQKTESFESFAREYMIDEKVAFRTYFPVNEELWILKAALEPSKDEILAASREVFEDFKQDKLSKVKIAPPEGYKFQLNISEIITLIKEYNISIKPGYYFFIDSGKSSEDQVYEGRPLRDYGRNVIWIFEEKKILGLISVDENTFTINKTLRHSNIQPIIDFVENIMTRSGSAYSVSMWLSHIYNISSSEFMRKVEQNLDYIHLFLKKDKHEYIRTVFLHVCNEPLS